MYPYVRYETQINHILKRLVFACTENLFSGFSVLTMIIEFLRIRPIRFYTNCIRGCSSCQCSRNKELLLKFCLYLECKCVIRCSSLYECKSGYSSFCVDYRVISVICAFILYVIYFYVEFEFSRP